jgi:protein-tyrosine phosphatase
MSILQNFLYSSYHKINNYLYLGNYNAAQDENFIREKDIKLVINVSKDLQIPEFYNKLGVEYYRIPINDSNTYNDNKILNDNLDYVINLIDKYRNEKKNVFVHCYAGMQRSAAIILSYIIYRLIQDYNKSNNKEKYKKITYDSLILFLKNKRPVVFKNGATFDLLLRNRYETLNNLIYK